jgi:hypothetical protein
MLEAGELHEPYSSDWEDPHTGRPMGMSDRLDTIARAYERNGFMDIRDPAFSSFRDYVMGRRVDPADHPAAPGDVTVMPPNPPDTDESTPSPVRARRRGDRTRTSSSPSPSLGRERRGGARRGKGKPPRGRGKPSGLRIPRPGDR